MYYYRHSWLLFCTVSVSHCQRWPTHVICMDRREKRTFSMTAGPACQGLPLRLLITNRWAFRAPLGPPPLPLSLDVCRLLIYILNGHHNWLPLTAWAVHWRLSFTSPHTKWSGPRVGRSVGDKCLQPLGAFNSSGQRQKQYQRWIQNRNAAVCLCPFASIGYWRNNFQLTWQLPSAHNTDSANESETDFCVCSSFLTFNCSGPQSTRQMHASFVAQCASFAVQSLALTVPGVGQHSTNTALFWSMWAFYAPSLSLWTTWPMKRGQSVARWSTTMMSASARAKQRGENQWFDWGWKQEGRTAICF